MLTDVSGFLKSLHPGDGVMADKGFLIDLMLAEKGCMLYTPPRCQSGRPQQQPDHTVLTMFVAQKRIHIGTIICMFRLRLAMFLIVETGVFTQPTFF